MLASVPTSIAIVVVIITGLGLGSIPAANLIVRRHGISDLRDVGDQNPGFWNASELIGVRAALPIFVADVTKGAAAAGLGHVVADSGQWWMPWLGAGAAMVGHAFPVGAGFRGGRSVLTFVGGALVFAPVAAGLAVVALFVVWAGTRRFDWAARAGVAAFPVIQFAFDGATSTAATGALMTFIGLRFALAGRRVEHAG